VASLLSACLRDDDVVDAIANYTKQYFRASIVGKQQIRSFSKQQILSNDYDLGFSTCHTPCMT